MTTAALPVAVMATDLLYRLTVRLVAERDEAVRREVHGALRPLERAVRSWATVPPSVGQAKACFELLLELEARLSAPSGPTV